MLQTLFSESRGEEYQIRGGHNEPVSRTKTSDEPGAKEVTRGPGDIRRLSKEVGPEWDTRQERTRGSITGKCIIWRWVLVFSNVTC